MIVTFSTAPNEVLLRESARCEELGVAVSLVPRLFERVDRARARRAPRRPAAALGAAPSTRKGWQFALKYALDRVVAALALLLVLLPLLRRSRCGTLLSLGRPVLFRQRRVGLDGRAFEMLKFRSMRADAADAAATARACRTDTAPGGVEGDDRRTPLGRFLRRTSLDELPQLLNVAQGDMSLVGPRPERPDFVELFEDSVHRYGDRHRVKSGITGWAQVHGLRGETSLADRVEWDNYYIENWSLWLDLKILLMTVLAVLRYFTHAE